MSRDRQIDEITKDICPYHNEYGTCEKCKKDFEDVGDPCYFSGIANIIIKNGYRKQSDVIDEFVERLKEAPVKCALPLFGLTTKGEIEYHFDNIMLQVRDAIDSIAKDMKGGAE